MKFPGAAAWFALSRRVRTLLVGLVAFVVLVVLVATLPVPYVLLSPGPTYNTLGTDDQGNTIIVIKGRTPNKTTGNLNLTTVSVSDPNAKETVLDVLEAWLRHDEDAVPRSSVFPPGQSTQQVDQQNTQDFTTSQDDATQAAACELGYPRHFGVTAVIGGQASQGKLRPDDQILSIDGNPVTSDSDLAAALSKDAPGTAVELGIRRLGKEQTVDITLGKPINGHHGGSLGVDVADVCQLPFTVDLGLGNQIGGPSAGLMFTLGIMDKVGKIDLTGGRFIAGTGEIDPSDPSQGKVLPIGGIQLKMIAARNAGATVFLAPAGNCSDVVGNIPSGLDVVKVDTVHHAVEYLQDLQHGTPVPHC